MTRSNLASALRSSQFGTLRFCVAYPPPPRSIGIIELGENRDLIQGLQSLTGKILSPKELRPTDFSR